MLGDWGAGTSPSWGPERLQHPEKSGSKEQSHGTKWLPCGESGQSHGNKTKYRNAALDLDCEVGALVKGAPLALHQAGESCPISRLALEREPHWG
ncbi:hypothetical protein NDU88_005397 [Pleurodeles waltl]|uniref:Uncharacterized protein n=1 Tax=Pleurodeles waltl TaxID=8319 RepID=A0AAV7LL09_PLEWA|nr:hypothetical protein NDU88_005397 [Pleurodeles waltl]